MKMTCNTQQLCFMLASSLVLANDIAVENWVFGTPLIVYSMKQKLALHCLSMESKL